MDVIVRPEINKDVSEIFQVNKQAFDRENEAQLVDNLRETNAVILSLHAVLDGKIVGHILFHQLQLPNMIFNGRRLDSDRWLFNLSFREGRLARL